MRSVDVVDPMGYTIFCDDVRQEITGKLIFMGVYRGEMLIHTTFPTSLTQFWVYTNLSIPLTYRDRVRDEIKVVVLLPNIEEEFCPTARIPAKDINWENIKLQSNDDDVQAMCRIEVPFPFSPLPLQGPGTIKVRCIIGDRSFRIGALQVLAATPIQVPQA